MNDLGPPLNAAWQDAVDALRRELTASGDPSCHGVELRVSSEQGRVHLTATAADGRATCRRVTSPTGLSAVAFGLLALAPGETLSPAPAPVLDDDPHETPPPSEPAPPRAPAPRPPWTVSVSAATGARGVFPGNLLVADVEVRADLVIDHWVGSLGLRASPFVLAKDGTYDLDAYQEAGLSLGLGRQLALGRGELVLSGVASVLSVGIENDALNGAASRAELRVGGVARGAYPVSSRVRVTVATDAEVSPTGLASSPVQGVGSFPTFTTGLRAGVEVSL